MTRTTTLVSWTLAILLAALYAFAGTPKLLGAAEAVEGFRSFGFSDGFRLFIGTCEVAGAIGLLIPRLTTWAASGLLVIMAGAVYTHLSSGIGSPVNAAVAFVLLAVLAWLRRDRALFLATGAPPMGEAAR
jgi:uncharacterized membrane protein YphA (DoxX/SURF4 family)